MLMMKSGYMIFSNDGEEWWRVDLWFWLLFFGF